MSPEAKQITLRAPTLMAWRRYSDQDTHLFGLVIDYDVLDFWDGERQSNGTVDQVVSGPPELIDDIASRARAAGWTVL